MSSIMFSLVSVLYVGVAIFFAFLAMRFVKSHERIADALEKFANKN